MFNLVTIFDDGNLKIFQTLILIQLRRYTTYPIATLPKFFRNKAVLTKTAMLNEKRAILNIDFGPC